MLIEVFVLYCSKLYITALSSKWAPDIRSIFPYKFFEWWTPKKNSPSTKDNKNNREIYERYTEGQITSEKQNSIFQN